MVKAGLRYLGALALLLSQSACQLVAPTQRARVTVKPRSLKTNEASRPQLSSDFCYGIHVTGLHPELNLLGRTLNSSCPTGAQTIGLSSRFVVPGSTVDLEVPIGTARKIDLIGIPKSEFQGGACPTPMPVMSAGLNQTLDLSFGATTIAGPKVRILATTTQDILPGDNTVELGFVATEATGLPYSCAESPLLPTFNRGSTPTTSSNPTPTFRVSSQQSQLRLKVYSNSTCEALVYDGTVTQSPMSFQISSLTTSASYEFYYLASDGRQTSPCLSTGLTYNYQSQTPTVSLSSPTAGTYTLAQRSSLSFYGTCNIDGSTIDIIRDSSTSVGQTSCTSNAYSLTLDLSASVNDGAHSYNARITTADNRVTNASPVSLTFLNYTPSLTLDAQPSSPKINSSNVSSYPVTGSCAPSGASIEVRDVSNNSLGSGSCVAGSFSININASSLSEGTNYLHATIPSPLLDSSIQPYTKDTVAPSIASGQLEINNSVSPSPTNTATVTVRVTGVSPETGWQIRVFPTSNCTSAGSTYSWPTTSQSVTLTGSGNPATTKSLSVRALDAAGNVSTNCLSNQILFDTEAPSLTASASNSYANSSNSSAFAIYGSCSENSQTVTLSSPVSQSTSCTSSAWSMSVNLTGVGDGNVNLLLTHSDAAGNQTTQTVAITKDTVAPTHASNYLSPNPLLTNVISPSLTLHRDADGSNLMISSDATCTSGSFAASGSNNSSVSPPSISANTTNYFSYRFKDDAGNTGSCYTLDITHDNTPPSLSFTGTNTTIDENNESSYTLTGTCESGLPVSISLSHSLSNANPSLPTIGPLSCTSGAWQSVLDWSAVPNGTITATATSTDAAGNAGSANLTITKSSQLMVAAAYTNASTWATWVNKGAASDYTQISQSSAACSSGGTSYFNCVHGGEVRKVHLWGLSSCSQVTSFADSLGAFEWDCRTESGHVVYYSRRLKDTMGLADLIDWTSTPMWKSVSVTASMSRNFGSGPVTWTMTSTGAAWASNTILQLSGSSSAEFSSTYSGNANCLSGNIYALTASTTSYGHYLYANSTVVTKPTAVLSLTSTGPLINSSTGGTPTDFHWIEGNFACNGSTSNANGIFATSGVSFNVLRKVNLANCKGTGVQINGPSNWLSQLRITNSASSTTSAILLNYANYNTLDRLMIYSNYGTGLTLNASSNNTVRDAVLTNNESDGLDITAGSANNIVTTATIASNTWDGVFLGGSGTSYNTLHNLLVVNNGQDGFNINSPATSNTFSQIATLHNAYNISFSGSGLDAKFTGNLLVGQAGSGNCLSSYNSNGLDSSCAIQAQSNASVTTGLSSQSSAFVGIVTSDTLNTVDSSGTVASSTLFTNPPSLGAFLFDNSMRVWGKYYSTTPFVVSNRRGSCVGGTCEINDWSLVSGSSPLFNRINNGSTAGPAAPYVSTDGDACPGILSGAYTLSPSTGTSRTSVFLKNAIEEPLALGGNNNGLCEAGESCQYTPNFGAYQGHGSRLNCAYSASGGPSAISMWGYGSNGR